MIYTGCDLQIAVFLLLSLFWTNTRRHNQHATTQCHHLHHSRHSECHPPWTTLQPFPRWKGSENAGVWRVEKKDLRGCAGFPALFPRLPGVDDLPVKDRVSPSWCAHGTPRRGWSRERGGAMGGAPLSKRTDTRRGLQRAGLSLLAALFSSSFSLLALLLRRGLLLFSPSSLALVEAWTGDAAAPVVWWTCALGEECRRGFAGHERSRGQARPRRRSWERERARRTHREVATPLFSLGLCVNDCGWRLSPVR